MIKNEQDEQNIKILEDNNINNTHPQTENNIRQGISNPVISNQENIQNNISSLDSQQNNQPTNPLKKKEKNERRIR